MIEPGMIVAHKSNPDLPIGVVICIGVGGSSKYFALIEYFENSSCCHTGGNVPDYAVKIMKERGTYGQSKFYWHLLTRLVPCSWEEEKYEPCDIEDYM